MSPAVRVAIVDATAPIAAALLFPVFLSLRAGGNQIIEAQPMDYALLCVATLLIASGVQLVPWRAALDTSRFLHCWPARRFSSGSWARSGSGSPSYPSGSC